IHPDQIDSPLGRLQELAQVDYLNVDLSNIGSVSHVPADEALMLVTPGLFYRIQVRLLGEMKFSRACNIRHRVRPDFDTIATIVQSHILFQILHVPKVGLESIYCAAPANLQSLYYTI